MAKSRSRAERAQKMVINLKTTITAHGPHNGLIVHSAIQGAPQNTKLRNSGSLQSSNQPAGWPSTSTNPLQYEVGAIETGRPQSALSYRQRDYPPLSPLRAASPQLAFDGSDSPPDEMFPPDRITLNVFQTGATEVRRVETPQPVFPRRSTQIQIPQVKAQQIARGGEGVLNDQITTTTTVEVFRTPIDLENPEKIILPPPPGIDERAHLVRGNGPNYERWTAARTETLINDAAPMEARRGVQWLNNENENYPVYRALPALKSPSLQKPSPPLDVPVLNTFDERWEPSRPSPVARDPYSDVYATKERRFSGRSSGRSVPIPVERVPNSQSRLSDPLQVDTSDSGYMAPRRSDHSTPHHHHHHQHHQHQHHSGQREGRRARIVEVQERTEKTTEQRDRRRARSGVNRSRHTRRYHNEQIERRNRSHSPQQQAASRERVSPRAETHEGYFEAEFGQHTPSGHQQTSGSGEIFKLYQTRDPLGNVIGHFDTYDEIRSYAEDFVLSPLAESEDSLVSETSNRNDKVKSDELERRQSRPVTRNDLLRHLNRLNEEEELDEEKRRRTIREEKLRDADRGLRKAATKETIFGINRPSRLDEPPRLQSFSSLPPTSSLISTLRRTDRLNAIPLDSIYSGSSSSDAPPPVPRYGPFSPQASPLLSTYETSSFFGSRSQSLPPPRGLHRTKALEFHPKAHLEPPVINVKTHVYDDPKRRSPLRSTISQPTRPLRYFELNELAPMPPPRSSPGRSSEVALPQVIVGPASMSDAFSEKSPPSELLQTSSYSTSGSSSTSSTLPITRVSILPQKIARPDALFMPRSSFRKQAINPILPTDPDEAIFSEQSEWEDRPSPSPSETGSVRRVIAEEINEQQPQRAIIIKRGESPRVDRSTLPTPPPPPPIIPTIDEAPMRVEIVQEPDSPESPLPPPPPSLTIPSASMIDENEQNALQENQIDIKTPKLPSLLADFERVEGDGENLIAGLTMIGTRRRAHPENLQFKKVTRSTSLSRIPEDRELTTTEAKKSGRSFGIPLMPSMSCDSIPFADEKEIEYREFIVEPRVAKSQKSASSLASPGSTGTPPRLDVTSSSSPEPILESKNLPSGEETAQSLSPAPTTPQVQADSHKLIITGFDL
ncbi:unnamed protein product, partial [Mesorhabditis belari]|uniref:Uncharacterized protein n=1 Tax=Mesorhabditis belari TaxID=2138241 RepID=A0AAF3EDA3_9BILA